MPHLYVIEARTCGCVGIDVRARAEPSLVGLLNDGSARPMAYVMAVCGAAAWLIGVFARRTLGAPSEPGAGAAAAPSRRGG